MFFKRGSTYSCVNTMTSIHCRSNTFSWLWVTCTKQSGREKAPSLKLYGLNSQTRYGKKIFMKLFHYIQFIYMKDESSNCTSGKIKKQKLTIIYCIHEIRIIISLELLLEQMQLTCLQHSILPLKNRKAQK